MNKIKEGMTIQKVNEQPNPKPTGLKIVTRGMKSIEAIAETSAELEEKLKRLRFVKGSQVKLLSFMPDDAEENITLTFKDGSNNQFTIANTSMIAKVIQVLDLEITNVRKATEAEIMEMAA